MALFHNQLHPPPTKVPELHEFHHHFHESLRRQVERWDPAREEKLGHHFKVRQQTGAGLPDQKEKTRGQKQEVNDERETQGAVYEDS